MMKKHLAELKTQVDAQKATSEQIKTKAAELTSAMVKYCLSLESDTFL